MDQIICASLSHTHYWYEVGMLKVPATMLCLDQLVTLQWFLLPPRYSVLEKGKEELACFGASRKRAPKARSFIFFGGSKNSKASLS